MPTKGPWEAFAVQELPDDIPSLLASAAKKYGVDKDELGRIAKQESSFNPRAVGPVTRSGQRAMGVMQLMPGTAKDMGVTDPFNAQQNVDAGAKYYAQLVRRYHGDTEKARAAYNFGMRNVDKGLPYPKETRDYIIKTNPSSASPPSIPPAPNATLAQASPPPGPWAAFAESPAPKPTGGSTGQALGLGIPHVVGPNQLPSDLPQKVGRAALASLPYVGATIGGILAPEGLLAWPAIAAAGVGAGAGSMLEQGGEKAFGMEEAPKSMSEFGKRTAEDVIAIWIRGNYINLA